MPIRYTLHDNRLTPDPNDRYARVRPARTVGLPDVARRIADSGSTLTRVDVESVLSSLQDAIAALLTEGANVNLPFANFGTRIQGTFADDEDQFDGSRHAVLPRVSAGAELRRALRAGVPVEKAASERPAPSLLHFTDVNTGERDGTLTPGGIGAITGSRLAFDADDRDQGVFFVGETDETRAEVVAQNTPSKLMVQIPAGLAAGDYQIEVRSAFGEELRSGRLDATLTLT